MNFGAFISALIYFVIFMAVIYLLIVVPYRAYQRKHERTVFGEPEPTKMGEPSGAYRVALALIDRMS